MQLAVVWQRHMHGEDYPALAARHGIAIPNARVLYARGIDKLRHDPDWRILAHDLGLIQESDIEELLK